MFAWWAVNMRSFVGIMPLLAADDIAAYDIALDDLQQMIRAGVLET